MLQTIFQYKSRKCLYINEADYLKLRAILYTDFAELGLTADFQILYVDHHHGDWMIVENQADLAKICQLGKGLFYFEIKDAPLKQIEDDEDEFETLQMKSENIGKLVISEQMKKMIEEISQKHIQRYLSSQVPQRNMLNSNIMLEQMLPPSRTKLTPFAFEHEKNLGICRPSRNIERLSPPSRVKKSQSRNMVSKIVSKKVNQIMGSIQQSCMDEIIKQYTCRNCANRELQMEKIIRSALLSKIAKIKKDMMVNPQHSD